MIQLLKGVKTSELETNSKLGENFKIYRFEKERDFVWNLTQDERDEQKIELNNGVQFAKKSDLFTVMKFIKHYFDNGIGAREGIEY